MSTRALIASTVACVCLLQAFILVMSMQGRFAHASAESGVAVSVSDYCRANTHGGGEGSTQHDHSQCCILCSSSVYGGLSRFAAVVCKIAFFPAPRTAAEIGWRFLDDPVAQLVGWTSSWSSRAPPSIS
ncbi:DUF2946 family protein [Methylosinus sporium]|uniref:DUF2946 family protein n=1 Tax=Methylosinus sporium TaxID=428 RepID=UPI00132FDAA2|nr:DUF2946 family protein [Methylosinus sporium]